MADVETQPSMVVAVDQQTQMVDTNPPNDDEPSNAEVLEQPLADLGTIAPVEQMAAMAGGRINPWIYRVARDESLWRPASVVDAKERLVHISFVYQLRKIAAVALIFDDDAGTGDSSLIISGERFGCAGQTVHYFWTCSDVLLSSSFSTYSFVSCCNGGR